MKFLLFYLLSITALAGNPQNVNGYKGLDMFSNNLVQYTCQDSEGAIWIHTENSVFRFNGNRTEEIYSHASDMAYGGGSRIFVFGDRGLVSIDTGDYSIGHLTAPFIDILNSKPILCAEVDTLLVGLENKVYRVGPDGYDLLFGLDEKDNVKSLSYSHDGLVLVGTDRGNIFRIGRNGEAEKLSYTSSRIYSIFEDSSRRIWIGTGAGALCLGDNRRFPESGNPIRTFCEDSDGNIIGGSASGLWSISKEGRCEDILVDGNRNCPVAHVSCDRDGGIWISTHYQGIFYRGRLGLEINKMEACDGNRIRQVRAMAKDKNGKIGIFTDNYGIFTLDPSTGKLDFDPRGLGIKFQCALYDKSESAYWCGEYKGTLKGSLIRIDPEKISRFPFMDAEGGIIPRSIYSIAQHRGELYIGSDVGMFVFDPKSETCITRRVSDLSHSVFSLYVDEQYGTLWVGSMGLYEYDFNTRQLTCPFPQSSPLSKRRCEVYTKDNDGSLLVGVIHTGLCRIKDGREEYIDKDNYGIENNELSFARPLNNSIIMLGNRSGISFVDTEKHSSLNYSSNNVPTDLSMIMGASIAAGKGFVLAGGKDGIILMNVGELSMEHRPTPFSIDELIVNDTESRHVSGGGVITLKHNQDNIKIGIAIFDYARIASHLFQCRLDGIDEKWMSISGEDYVSFHNLRPGKYTVRVRCSGSMEGDFIEQSLGLRIKPAWYVSGIALAGWSLLAFLIIATILMLAYSRVMLRNRLQQEKMVMDERTKMFIDISHRLRTPLTMILGNLEMFFSSHHEKFPGSKLLEASLRNAENMKDIISDYVDIEDQANDRHFALDDYSEGGSLGLHTHKLLVIDDNQEVRTLLKSIFTSEYDIIEADNGKEGLKAARNHQPDIIISDVQMPEMDGIALCAELRKDFTTRQIPIILLTAHASEQHNLEGILMGADDYITKPFNAKLLKARCRNLIENRRMLRDRFLLEEGEGSDRTKTSEDDVRFLNAAIGAVERNLGSPDLDVVKICSELSISRSTLTNYLRRLTGMTPGSFIEEIKLKRAATMLKETPMRIKEISDELGFSNPQYFTIRFKKKYGCPPSEYK